METRQLETIAAPATPLDAAEFRRVLGHHPTGVCVVTAMDPEQGPIGMTVGSFASVSLDPPLILFMPKSDSVTFERIRRIGTFSVNVLSADQGDVCRQFAGRTEGRFAGISWKLSPAMAPVIDGSVAWIDCTIAEVHPAGDHFVVIGAVQAMDTLPDVGPPLLFFQGGYGRFSTLTLTAVTEDALAGNLLLADAARPRIERLAQQFGVECHATGIIDDYLIQVAYSGAMRAGGDVPKVGLRLPFLPPMGALFIAWEEESEFDAWLARAGAEYDPETRAALAEVVAEVRRRGWAGTPADTRYKAVEQTVHDMARTGQQPVLERALRSLLGEISASASRLDEPLGSNVHSLSAPVFNRDGKVVLALSMNWLGDTVPFSREHLDALREEAAEVTATIGGRFPANVTVSTQIAPSHSHS
jgi:flavin reductase (DIM6/NTAB) family NADH-FMN oxidoreductase RutF/DNA-binding IclR family transcriptional regulator